MIRRLVGILLTTSLAFHITHSQSNNRTPLDPKSDPIPDEEFVNLSADGNKVLEEIIYSQDQDRTCNYDCILDQKLKILNYGDRADFGLSTFLQHLKFNEKNADGELWKININKSEHNVTIYSSVDPHSNTKRFKAVTLFDAMTPIMMIKYISNDTTRKRWDTSLSSFDSYLLQNRTGSSMELYLIHYSSKQTGPVKSREFVDVGLISYLDDGSIVSANCGLHPNETADLFPVTNSKIRGFNYPGSGLLLENMNNSTRATFILQSDLNGWLLPSIVNNIMAFVFVSFFNDLKKAIRKDWMDETHQVHG